MNVIFILMKKYNSDEKKLESFYETIIQKGDPRKIQKSLKAKAGDITTGQFYDFAEGSPGRTALSGTAAGAVGNFAVQLA